MLFSFDKFYLSSEDIKIGLNSCNSIKYAAYRTAAKLRIIQKASFMDKVQLRVISSVFERYQLLQNENSLQLNQREVESILSDIYFGVKKEKEIPLDINNLCRLMFSFLKNVFDRNSSNTVQVFSFKVVLTLLCEAKPREKYHYLFEQLADHNNCVSKKKLEIMLKKMSELTEYVGEGLLFGSELIPGTIESCFQCNVNGLGLSEDIFMNWLEEDPQLLVWLSTLYRMQISESVSHNVKCSICKMYPLIGLRYRCLRCLSYDMCQSCFFTGKLNKKHKFKHPVNSRILLPNDFPAVNKGFFTNFEKQIVQKRMQTSVPACTEKRRSGESLGRNTRILDEEEIFSRTVANGSRFSLCSFPLKELQNIISELENDSEKLIPQIDNICSEVKNSELNEWQIQLKNCLTRHKAQVRSQVQRLKLLKNYLSSKNGKTFLASTPMIGEIKLELKKRDLIGGSVDLSPIAIQSKKKINWEKMMSDNHGLEINGFNRTKEIIRSGSPKKEKSFEVPELLSVQINNGVETVHVRQLEPSVCLAENTLQDLESGFSEGISWLYMNENESYEKVRKENEEIVEKLQSDLKNILRKLNELSIITSKGKGNEGEVISNTSSEGIKGKVDDVDSYFLDLINGIEKLIGK